MPINYLDNESRSGNSLSALPFLSIGSSATALRQWLADREEHNYSENVQFASVINALCSENGATLAEISSLEDIILCDGEQSLTTFTCDGDGLGNMLLRVHVGNNPAVSYTIGEELGSVFKLREADQSIFLDLEEWATDKAATSTTTLSFFSEVLSAASSKSQGLTALITTGLLSENEDVSAFARAMASTSTDTALTAATAYLSEYLQQISTSAAASYDQSPDNQTFTLADYTPYKTSSLMSGVWSLISSGVTAIGSVLMICGGPIIKAIGAVATVAGSVATALLNAARNSEKYTFGSGVNLEYANAIKVTYSTDLESDYMLANFTTDGEIKPRQIANENVTRMIAPTAGINPRNKEYCSGALIYPVVKSAVLTDNSYGDRTGVNTRFLATPCGSHLIPNTASTDPEENYQYAGCTFGVFDDSYINYYNDFMCNKYASRYDKTHTKSLMNPTYKNGSEMSDSDKDKMVRTSILIGYVAAAMESGMNLAMIAAKRIDLSASDYVQVRKNLYITGTPVQVYQKMCDYEDEFNCISSKIGGSEAYYLFDTAVKYIMSGGSYIYDYDGHIRPDGYNVITCPSWEKINDIMLHDCDLAEINAPGVPHAQLPLTGGSASFGSSFFANLVYLFAKMLVSEALSRLSRSDSTYFYAYDMFQSITMLPGRIYWRTGWSANFYSLFPGTYVSDTPSVIADAYVYPPKFTPGTGVAAILAVAAVAILTSVAVIAAKRAWKQHVRAQVVKRERAALNAQSALEGLNPSDPGYSAAVKNYTRSQRRFQRYANRVGYSSNSVGTYATPSALMTTTSTGTIGDYINSALGSDSISNEFEAAVNLDPIISLISG